MVLSVLLVVSLVAAVQSQPCDPALFGQDSVVCKCSETYCDFPGTISHPTDPGVYKIVTSSRDGMRFKVENGTMSSTATPDVLVLEVNHNYEYQTMMGFGGAFTDSTGLNVVSLPAAAQENLLRSYFSPEGNEYNLCRVPIAGSDFSTRPYSYDDVDGDVALQYFNLTYEDYVYKLPLMRRAQELAERELLVFGSPWAPPAWMKENGMVNGSGGLLFEMRQPWSDYFVKFVQAYEAEGVPIWGLTPQNEPMTGFQDWAWNTCGWNAEDMRDFIKTNMGPTLEAAGMGDIKIMVLDHNRDSLPWFPAPILEDPAANVYVDGIALHWYSDSWTGPSVLDEIKAMFPDKFLLYTEACTGWDQPAETSVLLGNWQRAEDYAYNILEDVNHWSTGWVDWNMALDMGGGPNWANNFVDAPIIIDAANGMFYKQPMFYVMGHFSKFIEPGAKRAFTSWAGDKTFRVAGFHSSNNKSSVIVLNLNAATTDVTLDINNGTTYINLSMPAKSISTVLFTTPV